MGRAGNIQRALWSAAALLAVTVSGLDQASAQDGWLKNGKPAKGAPNRAGQGDFAILQIATTDPNGLMANWEKPTPGVNITTSVKTVRHRPIVTFIIFTGCRPDASGNCRVTADFSTLDAAGKSYDLSKSVPVWVGHPPPPKSILMLSQSGYGLVFVDKDRPGDYRVRATVTDQIAHVTLRTEQTLALVAK